MIGRHEDNLPGARNTCFEKEVGNSEHEIILIFSLCQNQKEEYVLPMLPIQ